EEVFKKMGALGFFGVSFPAAYGGSGMDFWAAIVVAQEFANANVGGLTMSLFAHAYLPLPLLVALGTEEQKNDYLIPAIKGDKIAALAITEPGAGSDVGGLKTNAKDMGDHYVLNGSKMFITNGTIADFIVVVAKTGEGLDISLFLVDTKSEGFSAIAINNKLGMHSSDTAQLFFEDCKVPKSALIGEKSNGFYYIMNNFQQERLLAAVTSTFMAEWALERAKQYTLEREAFGRAIAKFQVIRHKLAEMAVIVEACRSISYRAVAEYIEKGNKAETIITMAKVFTSEEALKVINDALQLHGGVGYTEDYGIARVYRDARLLPIGAGTTQIMYEILGKMIIDDASHTDKLK
ncbi:MAG TPA: acyl-CoA dehydrogenase, partial [Flavobacteriales bacterium]|nr:acyl-CoA dehydrogenase [Flavobacteriales bacterium]